MEENGINFCSDYTREKSSKAWNKLNETTNPQVFADEFVPSMEEADRGLRNIDFGLPRNISCKTSGYKPLTVISHTELIKRTLFLMSQWQ